MYLSFDIYNCRYCGKNVPRHVWLEQIDDEESPFCAPEVAQVFLLTRRRDAPQRRHDAPISRTEELRRVRPYCFAERSY